MSVFIKTKENATFEHIQAWVRGGATKNHTTLKDLLDCIQAQLVFPALLFPVVRFYKFAGEQSPSAFALLCFFLFVYCLGVWMLMLATFSRTVHVAECSADRCFQGVKKAPLLMRLIFAFFFISIYMASTMVWWVVLA